MNFQAALTINKSIANLHLYLGVTYKALEQYELARKLCWRHMR